ncbi:hypothetical protein [Deinococcus sonorensis]|uniref:Uncharacterized protein n=1 Tax=Deinococcus sonorensis TaxID=309891 RepID=A0ABV8Y8A3_9DEIO
MKIGWEITVSFVVPSDMVVRAESRRLLHMVLHSRRSTYEALPLDFCVVR